MKKSEDLPLEATLLDALSNTPQNPRYHAEGSVLAHTRLVLDRYYHHIDDYALSAEDREVLYWAVLLHDTGKIKATRWESNRWRSTGHERMSVPIALDVLIRQPEISPEQRRKILDLIRWHGFPLQFARQRMALSTLKLLGTRVDLKMLAIFGRFDLEGRECEDREWIKEVVQQFEHHDVPKAEFEALPFAQWQALYPKWNLRHKNAAWSAFRMEQADLLAKLADAPLIDTPETYGKKVYLTIGPPLAGKSTWIAENLPGVFRLSMAEHGMSEEDLDSDKYYADRKLIEFKHFLTVYLNRHRQVVLDGRNLNAAFRMRLNEMIRGLNVDIEYIVFESDLKTLRERNAGAENPLETERLEALYEMVDLVHPWEGYVVRYV